MDPELLDWLEDSDDPSLRYRILRELHDRDERDPRVQACRAEIPSSPAVRKLLDSMQPDGYWLQAHPKTGRQTGAGVEYGAFATTHFRLSCLAELGLDCDHPQVARAAERCLGLQREDGDWTDARGRWVLTWSPQQCPWKVGRRGQANRWLTFYALAAVRLRGRKAIPLAVR